VGDSDGADRPFIALIAWLRDLGEAFNAADRGYHDEAQRIQADAFAGIRALMEGEPAIDDVMPELRRRLDGNNPYFDTAEFIERAQAHIDKL
jgi:hypothetical protein